MQKTRNGQLQVAVIGKGRLGTSLAQALAKRTKSFALYSHLAARRVTFKKLAENGGPHIIIIVTRDSQIETVAKKALHTAGQNLMLVAHCAGSIAPGILPRRDEVMRATFHPIQTFAKPDHQLFDGITFSISTEDPKAVTILKRLAKELGAVNTFLLPPDALPLYHSMIVYGANFITLLGTALEAISTKAGIDETEMKSALRPILTRALGNMLSSNTRNVLTGPIARGDTITIERHRKALKQLPSEVLEIYDNFLELAKRYGLWNKTGS
jgi:predicted short-subunit dehydrogenase-like oxidoreductase (DUF2520 family)